MADRERHALKVRHKGRIAQAWLYFMKFLRMFVYQNDWKVLPMAALISGLVGFVMSSLFMHTMEGTLTGSFALVCICIWNGSFNSIQVICRERDVIKREHRSGMRVSSYVLAQMLYQLLLCLLQTIVTLIVTNAAGMHFPADGLLTRWFICDLGITIFLITYAADLMSLWISSLCRSPAAAMTVMPFMLVFQLIFSGGLISLPDIAKPLTSITVSAPGFRAIASLADVNSRPVATVDKILGATDGMEIKYQITLGQVLDALKDNKNNSSVTAARSLKLGYMDTIGNILDDLMKDENFNELRGKNLFAGITVGDILETINELEIAEPYKDRTVGAQTTLGEVVDYLATNKDVQNLRDEGFTIRTSTNDLMDLIGREKALKLIGDKVSEISARPECGHTPDNVLGNWMILILFIPVFSVLCGITLSFIDKDKR